MKSNVSLAVFLGISWMIVNSSGEKEVSCAFRKLTFDIYQSSPVNSNTNFALSVSDANIFSLICCLVWKTAEPLSVKNSCWKFELLKNAFNVFDVSIEPLSCVLNESVYSTSLEIDKDCVVINLWVPLPA